MLMHLQRESGKLISFNDLSAVCYKLPWVPIWNFNSWTKNFEQRKWLQSLTRKALKIHVSSFRNGHYFNFIESHRFYHSHCGPVFNCDTNQCFTSISNSPFKKEEETLKQSEHCNEMISSCTVGLCPHSWERVESKYYKGDEIIPSTQQFFSRRLNVP